MQKPGEPVKTLEKIAAVQSKSETVGRVAQEPKKGLVLVSPFDGIGGARRALEILEIEPALYISMESDMTCNLIVKNRWPGVRMFERVEDVSDEELRDMLATVPSLDTGIVIGGPPCQGFTGLNRDRKGFDDPRSSGVYLFRELVERLRRVAPHIRWSAMMENVASMSGTDREGITEELEQAYTTKPYWVDAELFGHIRRPRLYWPSWTP